MYNLFCFIYEKGRQLIQEDSRLFTRGAVIALYPSWIFLFGKPVIAANVFLDFIIKGIGVGIMGIISAFCTVLATDFYKHKIKTKLFKTETDGTKKENDNERAA